MSRTTAESIVDLIGRYGPSAVTLYGGYAVGPMNEGRVTFEAARISNERRNKGGRCTALTASYADGSRIRFTWSYANGARYNVVRP